MGQPVPGCGVRSSQTSDYSVGTVWGSIGMDFYLLDVVRGRFETPELRRRIVEVSTAWNADATIVENTELGRALVQDLRVTGRLLPISGQVKIPSGR